MLTPEDLELVEDAIDEARDGARVLLRREAPFMKDGDREFVLEMALRNLRPMVANAIYVRALTDAVGMEASSDFASLVCGLLGEHVSYDRSPAEVEKRRRILEPYSGVEEALAVIVFAAEETVLKRQECALAIATNGFSPS